METHQTTAPSTPKTSGLAVVSLVTALTCLSPLAIIFGHMALSRIKKSAGQLTGSGLALAGTIIGYIGLVSLVLFIIPTLFFGARAWKQGSDRAECIMLQSKINEAVSQYQAEKALQPGADLDLDVITERLGGDSALKCPAGGTITIYKAAPEIGQPACQCSEPKHFR